MDKIKIHVLHCGEVQVDKALPFHEETLIQLLILGFLNQTKIK